MLPRKWYESECDVENSEDDEEIKYNVLDVLMGWLSPEDEVKAQEFVEDLIKYHHYPALLPEIKTVVNTSEHDNVHVHSTEEEEELKASASLFVPNEVSYIRSTSLDEDPSLNDTSISYPDGDEAASAVDIMQDEETFFWSVAYDLVGHLQLKFPEIDPTRLCDLLKMVELDADRAHAVLKATLERENGTTQVCRHYLAGECRRADCMFVHDTHVISCRFWLRGMCLQAEHCVFAHEFMEVYNLEHASHLDRDYDSEDENEDTTVLNFEAEEMFPSLQSGNGNNPNVSGTDQTNLSLNFARAVSLESKVPPPSTTTTTNRRTPSLSSRALYHKAIDGMSTHKWLTTGTVVATQYKQLREEAYQLACARNRCFMGATRAYQSGNKALARSLSTQGQGYNTKMKQCHFLAASQIFETRNPKAQLYTEQLMDLHGLHVAEAVEFLAQMLPQLSDEGMESICLVTGSGHHSQGSTGNARLLPAVERFLITEGYQFTPVADRRGFVGMLMVDLSW